MKKVLILLFVSLFLTGCSKNDFQNRVIFSSWGSVTEVKILKQLIKDFENENPDIKIEFLHIPQNYFQKIHLLFASNTSPDVIFINNLHLPIYETKLENLNNLIDTKDFYPQAIESMTYENKLLAIPRDISNLVLYINLDKTSLPEENWTIYDLLKKAQETTNKNCFGISASDEMYWATPYLSYFGGGILDNNLNLMINSKESKNGIGFYKDLVYKYKVAPTKSQIGSLTLAQMFLDEKIAMYLSGRWMFPKISEKANFNWAVINFPYGNSPQLCDTSGWAISKDSKNKENAIKFLKYISSEESQKYFAQTGLIVPANIEASKLLNNKKHNENVFIKVIKHSQKTPVNKEYKKITDKINSEFIL